MSDFEVSGDYRHMTKPILTLAHKLRFGKIVSCEEFGKHSCSGGWCTHYEGLLLGLDDGSSCRVKAPSDVHRSAIWSGVLKQDVGAWYMDVVQDEFARLAAVYWVASQQTWKDLAEDLIPYLIAAIGDRGDEETTAKRQRV